MTRIATLALATSLLFACTEGSVPNTSPYAPSPSDVDEQGDETAFPVVSPLYTASAGGPCSPSLEHRPHNACDGEEHLGVDLISVTDADGDNRWEAGEALTIDLEFFTTRSEGEDHVNYPRVFVDGAELAVESSDDLDGVGWFYAILPGEPIHLTYTLTARDDAAGLAELIFTVGALNCEGNEAWGTCPTPSPLYIAVPVE